MGYRICYENNTRFEYSNQQKRYVFPLTVICFVIFCLTVRLYCPDAWQTAKEFCIPGDPAVTVAAFHTFSSDLKAGEPLGDAVESFCREILDGAKTAD